MPKKKKEQSQKERKKVLIIGLDNSGKTSILLSLTKTTNLLSYFSIKPTKGIQILNVENETNIFTVWEFGGQRQYRDDYLKNINKYMEEVNEIFYVVDIQDIDRYELAIEYLENILKAIKKPEKTIELSIFLHKFDPFIEGLEEYTNKIISQRLTKQLISIIPADYKYTIFKTSIYTIFRKTLFHNAVPEDSVEQRVSKVFLQE